MIAHQKRISVTSAELFTCGLCAKSFGTRGRQHKKTHSKPYRCDQCDKGFALRLDLRRHVHARHRVGNARFSCAVEGCGFEATRRDNLVQHCRRQHNQIRKFRSRQIKQRLAPVGPPVELYEAASAGNLAMVRYFLQDKKMISERAPDGSTVLHCASRAGHQKIVAELLAMGADCSVRNIACKTPLLEAIKGRNLNIIRLLLKNVEAENWEEVLVEGLKSGHVVIARELIGYVEATCGLQEYWPLCISYAAKLGHIRILEHLLTYSTFDPSEKNGSGWTALHVAASEGHSTTVQVLLGTEMIRVNYVTTSGITPLHIAARRGNLEVVELLLQHNDVKADCKTLLDATPLHEAACKGNFEVVKLLLQHNDVKPDCTTTSGETPLHKGARGGNVEVVKLLLQHNDVKPDCQNTSGETPLHEAARRGNVEVVKLLLQHNDVKPDCQNTCGQMPLHKAARRGNVEVVKLLLQHNDVKPDCQNTWGDTPLHEAAGGENVEVVKLLLQHNDVKPDCQNTWGETPLHEAARRGNVEVVKLLLEQKVIDINSRTTKDWGSRTALRMARTYHNEDIVNLLLSHGATDGPDAAEALSDPITYPNELGDQDFRKDEEMERSGKAAIPEYLESEFEGDEADAMMEA